MISDPVPSRVLASFWKLQSQVSAICISLNFLTFQTPTKNGPLGSADNTGELS